MNDKYILISNTIADTVANFMFYDRQEDEDLPLHSIQQAIENGDISLKDIKDIFSHEIDKYLGLNDE